MRVTPIALLALMLCAVTTIAGGATYVVDGDTDDRCVREDGTFRSVGQKDARAGDDSAGTDGCYVLVFELPTLGAGETVVDANLDVELTNIKSGMTGNVDFYGIRTDASSSAVVEDDFYQGSYDGDSGATALEDDICILTTSLGPISSDSTGDSNLAAFLAAEYAGGAEGGDYVFLRLSPDTTEAPNYKFYAFATANADDSGDRPVLTITTASNVAPVVDAGSDDMIAVPTLSVSLDGTLIDDEEPEAATTTWSKVSGPGTVTFGNASAVDTTASFDTVGTYVLRLTADDTEYTDTDDVTITFNLDAAGKTSTGSFQTFGLGQTLTGQFKLEFYAAAGDDVTNGVVGPCLGTADAFDDMACLLRFDSSGVLDVRDGGSYDADATVTYAEGEVFAVRMEVDISAHTYSVYITPAGQSEVTLATDYDFRTAQQSATSLDSWTLTSGTDSFTISGMTATVTNIAPTADAGSDQNVNDANDSGDEDITLDGTGSDDSDGTISSYVWKEDTTQIATGSGPTVQDMDVGVHTIVLTVTDDDSATDTDTVVVTITAYVNLDPTADAGSDQNVTDTDDSGDEDITLDGSGSSDSDGTISSYVWKEDTTQIATGSGPTVQDMTVGAHTIVLTVTDDDSATDTDTVVITISEPGVPGAYYVDQGHGSASDSNAGTAAAPWLTIQHAADNVEAGDTIYVKDGIYREHIELSVSGTSSDPITLQAYPGDMPVISGASRLTGWTQCTSAIAKGNPDYADIYYVDIDYRISTLFQDNIRKWKAREPEHGYWVIDSATTTTIVDTENLDQDDEYWNGGEVFYWRVGPGQQGEALITDFDSSTSTLTFDAISNAATPGDLYFMENKVELINNAGEWAVEDMGSGDYRVYYWAAGDGDPGNYIVESPDADVMNTGILFDMTDESYWIVDGFNIRHSRQSGIGSEDSATPTAGHNIIQNCLINHNQMNVEESNTDGTTYRNNAILYAGILSGTGVKITNSSNLVLEENEIAWSYKDGMKIHGSNHTLRRNYIHGQWMFQHADNLQTTTPGLDGLTLEDNLIWDSGQSYMTKNMDNEIVLRNNVIGGSRSSGIPWGKAMADGITDPHLTMENNTFAFFGDNALAPGSTDCEYDFSDNIFMMGHPNHAFNMDGDSDFTSDYNLYFFGDGISDANDTVVAYDGFPDSFATYQSQSGEDANGDFDDPEFTNAPVYYCRLEDKDRMADFTATRVYMGTSHGAYFAVGDKIEIDWDGVVRTITGKGTDGGDTYIDFTPGDVRIQFKAQAIGNWDDATDFTLDLTPATGSPALGNGSGGGDIGSSIDVQQYMNCDFDGDDVRDVPDYPAGDPGLPGYGPW